MDAHGSRPKRPAALRSLLKPVRTSAVRSFERVIGVRTHGDVLASGWVALWAMFRALEVSADDVFADLGSAKGRVLFMAARRPFKRVLGVERSHHLNRITRANIERTRHCLRCEDIEIQERNLREWRVPDDLTVAYLEATLTDWRVEPLRALVPFYLRHRFYERSCISTLDLGRAPDDSAAPKG